jgi:hypothetical protein
VQVPSALVYEKLELFRGRRVFVDARFFRAAEMNKRKCQPCMGKQSSGIWEIQYVHRDQIRDLRYLVFGEKIGNLAGVQNVVYVLKDAL